MEGGERRRGGTYEHAAAAVREINGDRVEVAVRAAGIGNGGGDGESAEDRVEEDAIRGQRRRERLGSLADDVMKWHPCGECATQTRYSMSAIGLATKTDQKPAKRRTTRTRTKARRTGTRTVSDSTRAAHRRHTDVATALPQHVRKYHVTARHMLAPHTASREQRYETS